MKYSNGTERNGQVFPALEKAAEENTFLTSLLEAYLPVTILLIIINLLYFILKVLIRVSVGLIPILLLLLINLLAFFLEVFYCVCLVDKSPSSIVITNLLYFTLEVLFRVCPINLPDCSILEIFIRVRRLHWHRPR